MHDCTNMNGDGVVIIIVLFHKVSITISIIPTPNIIVTR